MADFQSFGFDDHVKLFFPDPKTGEIHLPNLSPSTQQASDLSKISRDYTPRTFDTQQKTLCIDFVLHGAGPATDWAKQAQCGERIVIGGPRGSMVIPQSYAQHVFIGDETALPAISRRLEELPKSTKALAFIFVENQSSAIKLTHSPHSQVFWIDHHQHSQLTEYVWSKIDWTQKDSFFWIACEAEQSRQFKRVLTEQHHIDSTQIKAAGYWKKHSSISNI